ncbi:Mannan endo-1-4-beta-mannosidase 7 [Striga hermonthica]|uniref:mannan endo-1,4-beta-mannosidase n=1 Tax=Striga hermonthica TaxID=68872 RepID=A0A9N7R2B8_STRHE|nr:Mannan endo-1-4-beta-mannosidase 7 [Striga hermonthica]
MSLVAYSGFVQTKGAQFVLDDSPFIFNGFNAYWMMHVSSQPNQREKVSNVFREAANAGLTVCRTWAFSDGGDQALQISPGVYNEYVFQALDFVVSEAAKLSSQDDDTQMVFMRRWMTSHWRDSKTLLRKPMVFTEFGKSCKDKGFSIASRDEYMNAVYSSLYSFARGGGIGGGLVWQILDVGMESYADGYEIVLSESPSTSSIINQQSRQMTALQHMMSKP